MRDKLYLLIVLLLCLGSCASSTGYIYYVIDPAGDRLLAEKEKDDVPLTASCQPDAHDKAKCIGMFREEYFKMEKELLELRLALKECQAGH